MPCDRKPGSLTGPQPARLPTKTRSAAVLGALALTGIAFSRAHPADAPAADLGQWTQQLRREGASDREVGFFVTMMRVQSPAAFQWWTSTLRAAPADVLAQYLSQLRRQLGEALPQPLIGDGTPILSCSALLHASIPATTIVSADAAADGSCRVSASVIHGSGVHPIHIYIALPGHAWNGRFRGTGGAGYGGGDIGSLDVPVTLGYVVGATDTGNPGGTARFALDDQGRQDWPRLRDNAYLGIHDMTVVGKALTQVFYGHPARYAYFVGGSTGGRQALTEAQRYPEDYDGILALYPAIARDRYVLAQLWPQILMRDAHDLLPQDKEQAATAAAVSACDRADGVADGVIDDPLACRYDPAALIGTRIGDSLFTATDAQLIRDIWNGPRARDGSALWWGPTRGTDLSVVAGTGGTPLHGLASGEGQDWVRYFLKRDPHWDWTRMTRDEFERLFRQSIQEHGSAYGGDNPDLSGFRDRGGRLLILHGLADQFVPPQETIRYYRSVEQRFGSHAAAAATVRLFLVPGADHDFHARVPTPSPNQMMGALLRWVEQGHAPEQLLADLPDAEGRPIRTRPLYPFPHNARYQGTGSTDEAANFIEVTPP